MEKLTGKPAHHLLRRGIFFSHRYIVSVNIGYTRLRRRVPLVEQELLTLPEHLSSSRVFSGVRVIRSLALWLYFVDHCLSFCTFSFSHCVVCSSTMYRFWLPLWYLQTRLGTVYMKINFPSEIWPHWTSLDEYYTPRTKQINNYWSLCCLCRTTNRQRSQTIILFDGQFIVNYCEYDIFICQLTTFLKCDMLCVNARQTMNCLTFELELMH